MGRIVNIPGTSSAIKVEKKGKKYVYYMRDKEDDEWEIYRTKKSPLELSRGTDVGNGIEELLGNRTDYTSYNIKQINVELDKYFSDVTNNKDLCWLFIDDRCLQFDGNYAEMFEKIKNFKVWYK